MTTQVTFIFFMALRNVLWLDSSAKGTDYFTFLVPVNTFVLLTATYSQQQYKNNVLLSFHGNNCYKNVPHKFYKHTVCRIIYFFKRIITYYFVKQPPIPCRFNLSRASSPFIRDYSPRNFGLQVHYWNRTSWQVDSAGIFLIHISTHLSQGGFSWISVSHSTRRTGECPEKGSQITRYHPLQSLCR